MHMLLIQLPLDLSHSWQFYSSDCGKARQKEHGCWWTLLPNEFVVLLMALHWHRTYRCLPLNIVVCVNVDAATIQNHFENLDSHPKTTRSMCVLSVRDMSLPSCFSIPNTTRPMCLLGVRDMSLPSCFTTIPYKSWPGKESCVKSATRNPAWFLMFVLLWLMVVLLNIGGKIRIPKLPRFFQMFVSLFCKTRKH